MRRGGNITLMTRTAWEDAEAHTCATCGKALTIGKVAAFTPGSCPPDYGPTLLHCTDCVEAGRA